MQFSSSFSLQDWGSYMKGAWVLRRAWKIYQRTYTDIRRLYIKCVGLGGNSIGKWETFQAAYFVTILVVFLLNWTIFLRAIEVNQLFRSADRKNMNASKYGKRPKKKKCDGRCHFVVVPFGTQSWPSCPLEGQKWTQGPSGLCRFIRAITHYCAYLRNFFSSKRFCKSCFSIICFHRKKDTHRHYFNS